MTIYEKIMLKVRGWSLELGGRMCEGRGSICAVWGMRDGHHHPTHFLHSALKAYIVPGSAPRQCVVVSRASTSNLKPNNALKSQKTNTVRAYVHM